MVRSPSVHLVFVKASLYWLHSWFHGLSAQEGFEAFCRAALPAAVPINTRPDRESLQAIEQRLQNSTPGEYHYSQIAVM